MLWERAMCHIFKKCEKCDENVKHLQKAYLEFYVEYNPDMKIS